jgi:type I restriction enzyme, S subunit
MSTEPMQVREASAGHLAPVAAQAVPAGYKRTEVGAIPGDWCVRELCSLTRSHNSGIYKRQALYGRGCNIVGVSDIYDIDTVDGQSFAYVPLSAQECAKHTLHPDDLLYGESSLVREGIARTVYVTKRGAGTAFAWHTRRYSVEQGKVLSSYLYYYLQSRPARMHMISHSIQTAITGINTVAYFACPIAIPLPPEQRAIAEALSDVDGLIGALESLIVKKRAVKQGALQQLLTGKTRLPGFSGEWERVLLGNHVTFLKTGVNSRAELTDDGPIKYLHYGDIHTSNQVRLDPQVTSMPSLPEKRALALGRLRDGDLVLVDASEDLDGVGKSVEICGVSGAVIVAGLHTIAARFDKAVIADSFKAYLQFCPAFRDQLKRLAAGTKVFATNRTHISSVEIWLPGTKEQTAIATVLFDMDAEITALERRRDKTRGIKQGMMQRLLTGRVRLVKPAPAEARA